MPKTKCSGIMISDFVDRNGYSSLTDEEFTTAKQSNPTIKQYARHGKAGKDSGTPQNLKFKYWLK